MNITKYIGIKWNPVGREIDSGLDCWGFVRVFYENELGISLPSYSNISAHETGLKNTSEVIASTSVHEQFDKVDVANTNDILLFTLSGLPIHIAIALDGSRMIHAKEGVGVVIESFTQHSWSKRLEGIYRHKSLNE